MDVPDEIAFPLIMQRLIGRRRIIQLPGVKGECWEYTGYILPNGYAEISFRSKQHRVHRLVFRIVKGPIAKGLDILHSCDNTVCFNPAHLTAGTDAENIRQAVQRGRHAKAQNTHCPQGHAYEEHGWINPKKGWRACNLCSRIKQRIAAGWPPELAKSEPRRQGRSPISDSKWRRPPSPRAVKTHCVRGHELAGENLYVTPDGRRQCRACHHAAVRRFKPKRPRAFEIDAGADGG
jgi:hypothetical protein